MKVVSSLLLISISYLFSSYCMANITAEFHGKLIEVPCTINNDKPLEFYFGRVGINKIDGVSNGVTQMLNVKCEQDVPMAGLTLQVIGTSMPSGKTNMLKTDVGNLGIAIFDGNNDQPIELNKSLTIAKDVDFLMKAILTKADNSLPVAAGVLNTTATVVASYE